MPGGPRPASIGLSGLAEATARRDSCGRYRSSVLRIARRRECTFDRCETREVVSVVLPANGRMGVSNHATPMSGLPGLTYRIPEDPGSQRTRAGAEQLPCVSRADAQCARHTPKQLGISPTSKLCSGLRNEIQTSIHQLADQAPTSPILHQRSTTHLWIRARLLRWSNSSG